MAQDARPAAVIASSAPTRGVLALLGAFGIWGGLPLYLRELSSVPASQIVVYRLVFCCAFVLAWLGLRGAVGQVRNALAVPSTRRRLLLSAMLISTNWLVYVWAVGNGRVVESSLGYFINPLVNVALGVLFLRERLRALQVCAVALASLGVAYLTWQAHAVPWIALTLALSFGGYGLLRKTIAVEAMAGLGAETLLLVPFGVAYMVWCELAGSGVLRHADGRVVALLVLSGPVTAVPLWLFAYGARQVAYSTVGLLQYLGPSLQLALGVLVFAEPFPRVRAAGFALIWAALALYAAEGLWRARALARR
ncbi:MAG: EamA family transporter RarD [Polyangiales bacterium]